MAEQKQKEKDDLLREHKKTEREMIKKGKKPFFMKKCKCTNMNVFVCERLALFNCHYSYPEEASLGKEILRVEEIW